VWLEEMLPPGVLTGRAGAEVGIIGYKILLEIEGSQAEALSRTVFVTATDFFKFLTGSTEILCT
jgi:hypothetical protein